VAGSTSEHDSLALDMKEDVFGLQSSHLAVLRRLYSRSMKSAPFYFSNNMCQVVTLLNMIWKSGSIVFGKTAGVKKRFLKIKDCIIGSNIWDGSMMTQSLTYVTSMHISICK
jgi:hypothetical protein